MSISVILGCLLVLAMACTALAVAYMGDRGSPTETIVLKPTPHHYAPEEPSENSPPHAEQEQDSSPSDQISRYRYQPSGEAELASTQ